MNRKDYQLRRAEILRTILSQHYEAGRHDKCKRQIWRTIVQKSLPMGERTFWRYLELLKKQDTQTTINKPENTECEATAPDPFLLPFPDY